MRNICILLFITINLFLNAQDWSNIGANWKYSYMSGFGTEGYVEITYTGDTLINNQLSKKLSKNLYAYNYVNHQAVNIHLGIEYTYEDNKVVYIWFNNYWDTLYNFNANIGESWKMAKQPLTNACDSNSRLKVIAKGTKIINSITLQYSVVEYKYGNGFLFELNDTIVEKIGFINSYMFPYDYCNSSLDINEGGQFRCYYDNNFSTYKSSYLGECDYVIVDELTYNKNIKIYPNPSSNFINIIGYNDEINFNIYDLSGKKQKINSKNEKIDLTELSNGIYLLNITDFNGSYCFKIVKN